MEDRIGFIVSAASSRVSRRCFYDVSLFYDGPRAALPSEITAVAASTPAVCKLKEKDRNTLLRIFLENAKQNYDREQRLKFMMFISR